jgi:uncharacterized protein YggE
MKSLIHAAALSLALAAGPLAAGHALAQTSPAGADSVFRATTLNLSAYGETRVAPDMATINLGVVGEGQTAAAALSANSAKMNRVMAALRKGGIADKDIQTSGLNLNPQYVYVQNEPARLSGYQASSQVTVTVRDLKLLGAAVDATVGAGADQVNGVSFGLADPSAAENAARLEAVKALTAKADLYARATGHKVLRLVSLNEGGGYTPAPPPMPVMAMARMEKADATSVAPGELRVRVDVSAVYELAR